MAARMTAVAAVTERLGSQFFPNEARWAQTDMIDAVVIFAAPEQNNNCDGNRVQEMSPSAQSAKPCV
jgi:uncharacterized protein YifN (PemK superfamily)